MGYELVFSKKSDRRTPILSNEFRKDPKFFYFWKKHLGAISNINNN